MTVETTTKDKQITIDVPEDRVAEFYAFYGQFLAGFPGRRRGQGPGHRTGFAPASQARAGTGAHGPHHHRCGPHREAHDEVTESEVPPVPPQAPGPETTTV